MTTVLIANVNRGVFKKIHPSIKFHDSTARTCYFRVRPETFKKIYNELKEMNINPFAAMAWG